MLGLKLNHVSKRGHWSYCSVSLSHQYVFLHRREGNYGQQILGYQERWFLFKRHVLFVTGLPNSTVRPRRKLPPFRRQHFQMHFLESKCIKISINTSLKFVPRSPINKIPAMVGIMAWRRAGDKPLSELMMVSLLTHICVTQPQCVKQNVCFNTGSPVNTVNYPFRCKDPRGDFRWHLSDITVLLSRLHWCHFKEIEWQVLYSRFSPLSALINQIIAHSMYVITFYHGRLFEKNCLQHIPIFMDSFAFCFVCVVHTFFHNSLARG